MIPKGKEEIQKEMKNNLILFFLGHKR